jgi:septum formation protein
MKKIILASSSPRRKQILKQIGLDFEIVVSRVEEKLNPRLKPENQPSYLSRLKAEEIASRVNDAIVIGADSMVLLGNRVIGKPKNKNDAKRMLKDFSGTKHSIITGFTIIDSSTDKSVTKSVETKVWFKKLSIAEIESYLAKEKFIDKAGAYAIQGIASTFVKKIDGDYFGAVGLPVYELSKELKKFGVKIL